MFALTKILRNLTTDSSDKSEISMKTIKNYSALFQHAPKVEPKEDINLISKAIKSISDKISALKIEEKFQRNINDLLQNLALISDNKYDDIFVYAPYYDRPDRITHNFLQSTTFETLKTLTDNSYIEEIKSYIKILHALANCIYRIQQPALQTNLNQIMQAFFENDIPNEKSRRCISNIIYSFKDQQVSRWDDGLGTIPTPWDDTPCIILPIINAVLNSKTDNNKGLSVQQNCRP